MSEYDAHIFKAVPVPVEETKMENRPTLSVQTASEHYAVRTLLGFIESGPPDLFRLACVVSELLPSNAEATVAFRKMLEASDCFARSVLLSADLRQDAPFQRSVETSLLRFFRYEHLPEGPLRVCAALFSGVASVIADTLEVNAETVTGLRKLLEAKDCAVRALLPGVNRDAR